MSETTSLLEVLRFLEAVEQDYPFGLPLEPKEPLLQEHAVLPVFLVAAQTQEVLEGDFCANFFERLCQKALGKASKCCTFVNVSSKEPEKTLADELKKNPKSVLLVFGERAKACWEKEACSYPDVQALFTLEPEALDKDIAAKKIFWNELSRALAVKKNVA